MIRACRRRLRARVLVWLTALVFLPLLYIQMTIPVRRMFRHSNISTSCVIPRLNPFDPSIMQFMEQPVPLVCDNLPSVVYADPTGVLRYNDSALSLLSLAPTDLDCSYRAIIRDQDDVNVHYGPQVQFTPPHSVSSDFIHVTCDDTQQKSVMDMIISTIVKSKESHTPPVEKETFEQPSVVLFGLDSVSRSAAIRKLPKTVQYLTEELDSYDFNGVMKVGENTLPNLMALLTGLRCWSGELPHTDYTNKPYDEFPFIWKEFRNKGYSTFYGEDFPKFGTFTYLTRGFVDPPTTHYARPMWISMEKTEAVKAKLRPVFEFLEAKNVKVQPSSSLCYKNKPRHMISIDYLKQFMSAYKQDRRFALSFQTEASHEYQNFLSYVDDDILQFFKWLKSNGHLDNTILIFFSDHGARIEELRSTFVGRMEDRMPVLHIVLPQALKSKYPHIAEALQINTNRLTTVFDVHQTLVDVVNKNYDKPSTSYVENRERGISLFQPLPVERSCEDAWIPENYCACYTSQPLNVSSTKYGHVLVDRMITELNQQFEHVSECVPLSVNKVIDLRRVSYALEHTHNEASGISFLQFLQPEEDKSERFDISIETTPGHGTFEATYIISQKHQIKRLGDIVRTNKYGNQSSCVQDKLLKPLCYCGKVNHSTL